MIPTSALLAEFEEGKPRASGDDPPTAQVTNPETRVNPARAGMILRHVCDPPVGDGKPRASRDDPDTILVASLDELVNPARAGMIRPRASH